MRRSSKLGLLIVSVATLSISWIGVGGASPHLAPKVTGTAGQGSLKLQSGYGGKQIFCAPQPLSGTVTYRVSSGRPSIRAVIRHLPKGALVGINWANNDVRGYLIGTLRSDKRGDSIPGSERLFRPAESRGYNLVLTWPNTTPLATMWPCTSPAAATQQCERAIEAGSPITTASVESCLSGQLTLRHLCPSPSNTVFVILHGRTYVLSEWQKPVELPQQYGMGAITEACGGSPTFVVTPSSGLHNGEVVHVSVSGFPPGKARLSECASPSDANQLGCGPQPDRSRAHRKPRFVAADRPIRMTSMSASTLEVLDVLGSGPSFVPGENNRELIATLGALPRVQQVEAMATAHAEFARRRQ